MRSQILFLDFFLFLWLALEQEEAQKGSSCIGDLCRERIVLKQGMKEGRGEMMVLSEQTGGSKVPVAAI